MVSALDLIEQAWCTETDHHQCHHFSADSDLAVAGI